MYSKLPNKRRGVSKRWTSLSGPPCEDLNIEPNLWRPPTGNVGQVFLSPVPTEPCESPVGQDPPAHTCHPGKFGILLRETLDGLWSPPCANVPLCQIQSAPTRNVGRALATPLRNFTPLRLFSDGSLNVFLDGFFLSNGTIFFLHLAAAARRFGKAVFLSRCSLT